MALAQASTARMGTRPWSSPVGNMFLLTEATLFFLNLALNARIRDGEASQTSVVQAWIDGVATATGASAGGTTTGACSTPPLVHPSTIHSQTTTTSRDVASESVPQNAPVFSKISTAADADPRQVFAPSHAVNKDVGEPAVSDYGETPAGTSGMVRFP